MSNQSQTDLFARATALSSLRAAFFEELERDGPPGIDRVTPAAFQQHAAKALPRLHEDLSNGQYRCMPLQRFYRKKKSGGKRPLGICTVRDRIVQRALLTTLAPVYEKRFLDCSHGYRSGRSPNTALLQLEAFREQGYHTAWLFQKIYRLSWRRSHSLSTICIYTPKIWTPTPNSRLPTRILDSTTSLRTSCNNTRCASAVREWPIRNR